jgi:hypothetical protein
MSLEVRRQIKATHHSRFADTHQRLLLPDAKRMHFRATVDLLNGSHYLGRTTITIRHFFEGLTRLTDGLKGLHLHRWRHDLILFSRSACAGIADFKRTQPSIRSTKNHPVLFTIDLSRGHHRRGWQFHRQSLNGTIF